MTSLRSLQLQHNRFSGPLPDFSPLQQLERFMVPENEFTGALPPSLGFLPKLNFLSAADNHLVGGIPQEYTALSNLAYFDVHKNALVSATQDDVDGVFNEETTPALGYFDISMNGFSGSIPSRIFAIPAMRSVIMSQNCFAGEVLPESAICDCTGLQDLMLDGLAAGDLCARRLWSNGNAFGFDATLPLKLDGTLPNCIFFDLVNIRQLHLAGNGLRGRIDDTITAWPPSLSDLSLAHNRLSQPLPVPLQQTAGRILKLDLSFNKFNGTLEMTVPAVNLTRLDVNRFSGELSKALISPPGNATINILKGNDFSCDGVGNKASWLPQVDPGYYKAQCGTTIANSYLIVFAVACAVGLALWFRAKRRDGRERSEQTTIHTASFLYSLERLQYFIRALGVLCLVLLVPTYAGLATTNSSRTFSYLWSISAAFKTGMDAVALLMVMLSVAAFAGFALTFRYTVLGINAVATTKAKESEPQPIVHRVLALRLAMVFLVTAVVSLCLNVGFVFIIRTASSAQQSFAQVALGMLNPFWPFIIKKAMSTRFLHRLTGGALSLDDINGVIESKPFLGGTAVYSAFLAITCQVIAPLVATMVADSKCFLDVFYRAEPITATFKYTIAYTETMDGVALKLNDNFSTSQSSINNIYKVEQSFVNSQTYYAPFFYQYECASTVLEAYAPVVLSGAIFKAFGVPLFLWLMRIWVERGRLVVVNSETESATRHSIHRYILRLLPKLCWPRRDRLLAFSQFVKRLQRSDIDPSPYALSFEQRHKYSLNKKLELLNHKMFYASLISDLALVVSFGFVSPPLALPLLAAMQSSILVQRTLIINFTKTTDESAREFDPYVGDADELERLDQNCRFDERAEGTPILSARWLLLIVSVFFSAFFVFDSAGDTLGTTKAEWVPIVQIFVPTLAALLFELAVRRGILPFFLSTDAATVSTLPQDRRITIFYKPRVSLSVELPGRVTGNPLRRETNANDSDGIRTLRLSQHSLHASGRPSFNSLPGSASPAGSVTSGNKSRPRDSLRLNLADISQVKL